MTAAAAGTNGHCRLKNPVVSTKGPYARGLIACTSPFQSGESLLMNNHGRWISIADLSSTNRPCYVPRAVVDDLRLARYSAAPCVKSPQPKQVSSTTAHRAEDASELQSAGTFSGKTSQTARYDGSRLRGAITLSKYTEPGHTVLAAHLFFFTHCRENQSALGFWSNSPLPDWIKVSPRGRFSTTMSWIQHTNEASSDEPITGKITARLTGRFTGTTRITGRIVPTVRVYDQHGTQIDSCTANITFTAALR